MLIDRIALFNLEDYEAAKQSFADALQLDSKYGLLITFKQGRL